MGGMFSSIKSSEELLVTDLRQKNCVVIFAKSECPYSTMAKRIFEEMQVPYKAVDIDLREDGDNIQDYLGKLTGAHTVPRVFVNGECIGGGDDTKALQESGKLKALVRKCHSFPCKGCNFPKG